METTFVPNMDKMFVKPSETLDIDEVQVVKVGTVYYYLAYNDTGNVCYLSTTGKNFIQVQYPSDTCKAPTLSEDGSAVYLVDTSATTLYTMPLNGNLVGLGWTEIPYTLPTNIRCNSNVEISTTPRFANAEYSNIILQSDFSEVPFHLVAVRKQARQCILYLVNINAPPLQIQVKRGRNRVHRQLMKMNLVGCY